MTIFKKKTLQDDSPANIFIIDTAKKNSVKIVTERLIIQPFDIQDLKMVEKIYGDASLTKYFDHGVPRSKSEVIKLIQQYKNKDAKGLLGLFSIFTKNDHQFIGCIDATYTDTSGMLEIGYILDSKFHNQGFATETVKAFLYDYLPSLNSRMTKTNGFPIQSIMATVHPENIPSRKLLEKLGMKLHRFITRFQHPRLEYIFKLTNLSQKG